MTLSPGIHEIAAGDYHTPDTPTLSASIANLLLAKSPRHAWAAHPALNPDYERKDETRFDLGSAAHRLFLEGDDAIEVCPFDSWRTKAAKEQADAARTVGRIPLLPDQAASVRAMVAAAREQLDGHSAQPPLFADGKPEQTLVWEDDHGVVCRARLDWLRDDYQAVDDMKTSGTDNPRVWTKNRMWDIGAPLQARFYQRGVRILTGIEPLFRFVLVGTEPPYATSVVDLAPDAVALADAQIDHALKTWANCLTTDDWPAYSRRVYSAEAPPWLEVEWLEREAATELEAA